MAPDMVDTVPDMVLNNVLLPAPLGPTMDTKSPSRTATDTPFRTGNAEYPATRLSISSSIFLAPFFAQVGFDDTGVLRNGLRISNGQHFAVVQHDKLVNQPDHRLHGVLDDDDGHALRGQFAYGAHHIIDFALPQAGESFVQQQQFGLPGHGAGQFHQAQLARR